MKISIIVAITKNNVIGKGGIIPWRIKGEQRRFRELTTGNTIIMGRNSYDEIGKPLPNRNTIVVSRTKVYEAENCKTVKSLSEALELCKGQEEVFISGGGQLYAEALPLTERIYLTIIDKTIKGDVFFTYNKNDFYVTHEERIEGEIPFTYYTLEKKKRMIYNSPIGNLLLTACGDKLSGLEFIEKASNNGIDINISNQKNNELIDSSINEVKHPQNTMNSSNPASDSQILSEAINQLDEYFAGKRTVFELPLYFDGTEFQKSVWQELTKIAYGKIASYKDIATALGNPKAVRAIGGANNKNPIGIIVPCHRVIGANGDLVGYAGGVWRKKWLLELENVN